MAVAMRSLTLISQMSQPFCMLAAYSVYGYDMQSLVEFEFEFGFGLHENYSMLFSRILFYEW